jgi:hypothetical protein
MRERPPRVVIAVMKAIEHDVRAAVAEAGLGDVPVHLLPFPGRTEHRERYVGELTAVLRSRKGFGVVSRRRRSRHQVSVTPDVDARAGVAKDFGQTRVHVIRDLAVDIVVGALDVRAESEDLLAHAHRVGDAVAAGR